MNKTIQLLNILCSQRVKIEELDGVKLSHEMHDRVMHILSLHDYIVVSLENYTETLEYAEDTLAYIEDEIEEIFNSLPTIIIYRGITAEIFKATNGYECRVADVHGNTLRWFLYSNHLPHAIAKAECSFDSAILYFRGLITSGEFFGRIEEFYV